jgi:hypothetical protein
MKLKSKHLVEILKNISDTEYLYTKNQLYKLLSESLDNNNIITLSAEHTLLIDKLCSKEFIIKEYLQKEGVFNKENMFSENLKSIGDLFIPSTIEIAKYTTEYISTGRRSDLKGRALFIHNTVEIILHKCSMGDTSFGTIIEFVKKES